MKYIGFLNEISYAYRQYKGYSGGNDTAGHEYQARMVEDWATRLKRNRYLLEYDLDKKTRKSRGGRLLLKVRWTRRMRDRRKFPMKAADIGMR